MHAEEIVWLHAAAGRKVYETSDVLATFPRPQKPLELYEFEVRPGVL